MFRPTPIILALAAFAPAMSLVYAQSAPSEQPTADAVPVLKTVTVTASRSGEAVPVDQLGASVTVIDAEQMEQRQTRIVSDVLRDVPGVAVSRTGTVGSFTQVRLRGTEGNHVLVLIDGIKVSNPYSGEYDFSSLLADDAARVEVLRGQQSSLWGSDAIGGVIQYSTLTGAQAPGIRARVEGGSFGTLNTSVRAAGVNGDLDYAISATNYHTDGQPTSRFGSRNVGVDSVGLSAKGIYKPSGLLTLTGVARYSYTDADNNKSEADPTSPIFGYTIDSPDVHVRNEAFYGLLQGELRSPDGRWTHILSGQMADTTSKGFNAKGFDYGNKGQRTKGSLSSTYRFGSDAVQQRVTAALDAEREEFQNTTPSASAFQGKRATNNVGVVAQYEAVVNEAVSLGASLRHDDNNRFDNATTWRLQGSYALPSDTRLHAAYGTGIKNPGYFELYGYSTGRYIGNPDLQPEKSKGWEIGVAQELMDQKFSLGATYFDSKLTDEIYTTYPAPSYVATPGNRATNSTQRGLELSASARPHRQVQINAAYTYLDAKEDGIVEVRRPKNIASLNLTGFSADGKLASTLTARYNGKQQDVVFTDPSYVPINLGMPSYTLVNLNVEYQLSPKTSVYGRIENLLDKSYEEVFSYATTGRAAYVGVRTSF